jgi:2-oxoglutarate dehydrogenase E2 component (dihydrolipoamide succinyltransferase)
MNAVTSKLVDIKAPENQEEGTRSRIARWLKQPGDSVKFDEPLVELETDKVAMEVAAPADGVLAEILLTEETDVEPGALLGRIDATPKQDAPKQNSDAAATEQSAPAARETGLSTGGEAPKSPSGESPAETDRRQRLSPLVKRLIKLHDVDPADIQGSGIGGRVCREDILAYVDKREAAPGKPQVTETPAPSPATPAGSSDWVPHDSMRRRIAEHMVNSLTTAPHVTSVFEADFSRIIAHRKRHKADFEARGVKLTFTAYFVAALAEAVRAVPTVNSRFHEQGLEVFKDVNVGVGTALGDKGLIVPVIHMVQTLNLLGIAERLQAMTEKARTGKIEPADVRGGTITISNHGVSGSLVATPIIINQPQSAILGIGKLEKRVCVMEVDGQDSIQIRPKAFVTLTIDHRVLDGHQTNTCLARLIEVIENWPEDGA